MPIHRKKRKFEMGRQPSMTKVGEQKVVNVRGRGSGYKYRALKLSEGNFMWVSEGVSRKCKILEVLYNASNNELVRTQTLVKNCIVSVDSTPFKYYWYVNYTDVKVNRLPEIKDLNSLVLFVTWTLTFIYFFSSIRLSNVPLK